MGGSSGDVGVSDRDPNSSAETLRSGGADRRIGVDVANLSVPLVASCFAKKKTSESQTLSSGSFGSLLFFSSFFLTTTETTSSAGTSMAAVSTMALVVPMVTGGSVEEEDASRSPGLAAAWTRAVGSSSRRDGEALLEEAVCSKAEVSRLTSSVRSVLLLSVRSKRRDSHRRKLFCQRRRVCGKCEGRIVWSFFSNGDFAYPADVARAVPALVDFEPSQPTADVMSPESLRKMRGSNSLVIFLNGDSAYELYAATAADGDDGGKGGQDRQSSDGAEDAGNDACLEKSILVSPLLRTFFFAIARNGSCGSVDVPERSSPSSGR